jgi:two-component system chemotaxis response regulator CheB
VELRILIAELGGKEARELLKKDPRFEIATAKDISETREKAEKRRPNLICLDYATQQSDYAAHLRQLALPSIPTMIFSPLTKNAVKTALAALAAGAVDFAIKPRVCGAFTEKELIDKVYAATKPKVASKSAFSRPKPLVIAPQSESSKKIIAIGASTGGTEALKEVLTRVPKNSPGIVIVQHMPSSFTGPFAQRLDSLCEINVREAKNGDEALVNQALIAPGDRHMILRKSGLRYYVEIIDGDKVSGHRPSVDALFDSVALCAGANAVGVILTGMGGDGARGLLKMRKAGAKTVAQDEKTCVVFGMPKVAIELGGVDKIAPLDMVAFTALQFAAEI